MDPAIDSACSTACIHEAFPTPGALWSIENNLSLSNMDFDEFVDAADEDGVFRDL
ncbi:MULTISPECIES: hypothetical protein [Streptomyces]|uniref:DUF6924 domain-containing protein n=1 Tax=Streptomyces luteosporeus TaxID=173856 RepID=A0ABP6GLR1_9ACTN